MAIISCTDYFARCSTMGMRWCVSRLAARDCIQYLPMADKILCAITSVGVALAEVAAEKCLVASSARRYFCSCCRVQGKGGQGRQRERGWSGLSTTVRKVLSL